MRDLRRSLLQHDSELLRVIAGNWGLELGGLAQRPAAERLAAAILAADWPAELDDLPAAEQAAVLELLAAGGRSLADPFFRRFGVIRPVGPGRLAREQPWLQPGGPAEALWYRGLLFRTFEQTELGNQEVVYLPDDLRERLPAPPAAGPRYELVPASGRVSSQPAAVGLVDDCCTLLAFLQCHEIPSRPQPALPEEALLPFLRYKERARLRMIWQLAAELELWRDAGGLLRPQPRNARRWLAAPAGEQATLLARAWLAGTRWNDLWQVPSLEPEATGWLNNPHLPRQLLLALLAQLPPQTWWALDSLPPAVKAANPDFQRTAGDYEAWYIKECGSDQFLMGYAHWDQIEGALLRFLVSGPLAWLGLVELGQDQAARPAFRASPAGQLFAREQRYPPPTAAEPPAPLQIHADGRVLAPAAAGRLARFQVARLADWEPVKAGATVFGYRLTAVSLRRAVQAEIPLDRALAFLEKQSGQPLPSPLKAAIDSWQQSGIQVILSQMTVLQVRDPAVLEQLRASPKVRTLLGETLGPLAVAVRTADWDRLVSAIAELGLLTEVQRGR